ncbi:FIST N-terminal domain-containing protein [uncultured Sunxiuqinia sp.]|uniref:FIST signal transduction protein n=1 Tax=uncultured Sunxiuqinia sp. TaxID=1573825 RepID=UPI002AA88BF9|nr:FIST N-terminal domain-containing protein [uncultured Sunxiuqinia sp.]
MKIVQAQRMEDSPWQYLTEERTLNNPLVLVFGSRFLLEKQEIIADVKDEFPYEHIIFGSTAGEIAGINVKDETIVVSAIEFEKASFLIRHENILDYNKDARQLGQALGSSIPPERLAHVFVVSEGTYMNGSSLIAGMSQVLEKRVALTGGLCGDGSRFEKTLAGYQEAPKVGEVIAVALYGDTLDVSFASFGGWIPFGPERIVTRSEDNILYEMDGVPALEIYKRYLGDKANELPQASLLFPLNITFEDKPEPVVRTILNIDSAENSMILAGDVPMNSKAQLMMASVDGIASGAAKAAELGMKKRKKKPELALLVSCIGRKLVMDQRIEEEIEEVFEVIGKQSVIAGFYSYGEIAPFKEGHSCELHNQTMTLTLISE